MELNEIQALANRVRSEVHRVVVGQEEAVGLLTVALLARGHVLFEGVPGTAKTLLARTFAEIVRFKFKRIQFTPDLMPGDVIGTNLFNFQTNEFVLTRGPIFTELLLADEINRTPPKTQAALLEAMQERTVTVDGTAHDLGDGFMVVATQNPIEQEGTYPLPEAQLDRFLFKVEISYPTRDQERHLVALHGNRTTMPDPAKMDLNPVATIEQLRAARARIETIMLAEPMIDYIVDIVRATRTDPTLIAGASPRAANMLASAVRALAAMEGRDYVIPDDVKRIAVPALAHRLVLSPAAEIEGSTRESAIQRILSQVPAPR